MSIDELPDVAEFLDDLPETGEGPDPALGPASPTHEQVLGQLVAVAFARREATRLAAEVAEVRGEFEQEISERVQAAQVAASAVKQAEGRARAMIVALGLERGSRKPIPGGSVINRTRLVYDRGAAYAFCLRKQMFLKLDEPAFEVFAKASPAEVAGIVREETYQVGQIASDLTKVLPSGSFIAGMLGQPARTPEWRDGE